MAASMNESMSFKLALKTIFGSWTGLQLAVQQGFGGSSSHEKAAWLIDATEQWFKENNDLEAWEVTEFFDDVMNSEFDTVVDDGSTLQVAKAACQLYNLWKRGQHDEMQRQLSQIPSCNAALAQSECKVQESEDCFADDAVSDEETMDSESPAACSSVDAASCEMSILSNEEDPQQDAEMEEDDGWTVVKKGKKKS